LLAAFCLGIAWNLVRGREPDCHCFGQIHSAPAGPETLIRNGVLAAMALYAVINGPGPAIHSWVSDRSGAELAAGLLGLATALLAIFALQLWTEVRQLRTDLILARNNAARSAALAPPGLPIGTEAPEFSIQSMEGETVSLGDLRAPGLPVLILFTSPNCGSCTEIFPSLRRWQQTLSSRLTIAVLTTGDAKDNQVLVDNYGLERLLLQPDGGAIIEAYRVRGTPTAVLVDPAGKIASIAAESVFEIEPMVRHVLRGGADGNGLQVSQHGATA
jgi:peroxiredoxin